MAANRALAPLTVLVIVLLVSVGVAKARPVRSNLGLTIGAGGGLGIGLDLGLGGSGSASSSGQGSGYGAWSIPHRVTGQARALGMVTAPALPTVLGMRARHLVVDRARHRARAQGLVWARGLWA